MNNIKTFPWLLRFAGISKFIFIFFANIKISLHLCSPVTISIGIAALYITCSSVEFGWCAVSSDYDENGMLMLP